MRQCGQDRFNLKRFIDAQDRCYSTASRELTQGKKVSHWMWFIFPQLDGLGSSPTAKKYAIKSLEEATAYLADPLLGPVYLSRLFLQQFVGYLYKAELIPCSYST